MKKFNLKPLTMIILMMVSHSIISQTISEKIWVTFETSSEVPNFIEGRLVSPNSEIQNLIESFNIINVEQAVPSSRKENLRKIYEIECNCDASLLSGTIEKNITSLKDPQPAPKYELLNTPNDYSLAFPDDYALNLIKAKGAWEYTTGDSNIVIGISDGNFYTNHEELVDKYTHVDVLSTPTYYYQHGTAVAVTAAGNTNNAMGKSSIGYNCKLDLRGMNYDKVLQASYAGVKVINISWTSGCSYSSYVQQVINEAHHNGTILVAAAGNGSTCGGASNLVYPAAHDNIIAVSSVGPTDNHEGIIGDPSSAHQHNSSVDICAPGYNVGLTVGPGWYLTGNGSSFAAPMVSGTIGLMLSLRPCLTYDDVLKILQTSAVNIDLQNPAYAGNLGAGRLNAEEALRLTSLYNCEVPGTDNNGNSGNSGNTRPILANVEFNNVGLTNPHVISNPVIEDGSSQLVAANTNVSASEENNLNVDLFPNPSTGSTRIMWDLNEAMTLKVVDVNGSIVFHQEITTEMSEITIDIIEKGIYFIQLEDEGNQKWFGRFVRI